jgi:vanadium chloroperoxidase
VSEELNGVNKDNKGTVRPRHVRKFDDGLWEMIIENATSRIFLGVHWIFDGFAVNAQGQPLLNKGVDLATGVAGVGGVPLGLAIADDIFDSNMQASSAAQLPQALAAARALGGATGVQATAELTRVAPRQPWPLG